MAKKFPRGTLCAILTEEMVRLTLGKRLIGLREQRGLSREELAKRLNLSYWAIAKYETDERMPSSDILSRLADFFGVSIDYLVGRTDDPGRLGNDSTTTDPALPDWVKKLPPDMQKFVEEESKHGWPYLRLARGLKMKDLSPAELEAIVETWMDAKRRYEKEFGPRKE
ncbi:MAG: helix-turn-helix transcriptional regulator [Syntrophothermus sp.]|uniref:helix-turn-helix domain-containing protein n=1 Tax=Syntrophothermus sp. TaxID=2736299 RepID=UPI00257DB608|nr:helix-turn-helix transcriptional regulator [Syntrophothermus sp.]NSW84490.1 helix-turn-helix transcriptional regulator [Syntrophothermus sp.]